MTKFWNRNEKLVNYNIKDKKRTPCISLKLVSLEYFKHAWYAIMTMYLTKNIDIEID